MVVMYKDYAMVVVGGVEIPVDYKYLEDFIERVEKIEMGMISVLGVGRTSGENNT